MLDESRRLSTDIDIIVDRDTDVDGYIEKAGKADSYVKLNVKMEYYYRIKDSTGTGKCGGVTEDE